ncbi:MAG: chemotaxis protein CheX [Armatimonadota bacterium]
MTLVEQELFKATARTFEEAAFLFPEEQLEPEHLSAPPEASAVVRFDGPLKGRLVINCYGSLLPALAANMLGSEECTNLETQKDAFREVANMICGNALPRIAGSRLSFHIQAPLVLEPGEPFSEVETEKPTASVCLGLEGGRVEVQLFLEN